MVDHQGRSEGSERVLPSRRDTGPSHTMEAVVEELIQQLMKQVGLDADQARQVMGVVSSFLKDKLPADVMNQLDGAIAGLGDAAGQAAGAAKDAAEGAADAASNAAGAATDAAGAATDKAQDAAGGLMSKIGGLFGGDDK